MMAPRSWVRAYWPRPDGPPPAGRPGTLPGAGWATPAGDPGTSPPEPDTPRSAGRPTCATHRAGPILPARRPTYATTGPDHPPSQLGGPHSPPPARMRLRPAAPPPPGRPRPRPAGPPPAGRTRPRPAGTPPADRADRCWPATQVGSSLTRDQTAAIR